MKKEIVYRNVKVSDVHLMLEIGASCPVRVGYQPSPVGRAEGFRCTGSGIVCDVTSDMDLKGYYPVLSAELPMDGPARLLSLTATTDKMSVDETLEPFI